MPAERFYFLEIVECHGDESTSEVRADLRYATVAAACAKAQVIQRPGRVVRVYETEGRVVGRVG